MRPTPILSIVVPCYNEATGLPGLLAAYDKAIIRDDIEIILVNNGSTDKTADVLTELTSQYNRFLKILSIETNQGYGHGVQCGLRIAQGTFMGWTHGDMQTPPTDILTALSIIEKNNFNKKLFVKGLRKKRSFFDTFFTLGMSIFETLYLRQRLIDINAQPNIFHRDFFYTWENPPLDYSLDLYALYQARRAKLTIVRFPVLFLPRTHGHSSWNTGIFSRWKFIQRTITFSASLKKRLK